MGLLRPSSSYDPVKGDNTKVSQIREKVDPSFKPNVDQSLFTSRERKSPPLFSFNNPEMINELNRVSKGRFSINQAEFFDSHDQDLMDSYNELKESGEEPDMGLIKSLMAIETGFSPRKNHLGYEGYPQTNEKNLKYINEKYGKDFTIDSLYDVKESAKFMHYFIKDLKRSKYVKSEEDIAAAYNWGTGNYGKYLRKSASLPEETKHYIEFLKTMKKYY